MLQDKSY
ncbi:hypothetical protein VTH06DRAFT_7509 [Thermothelomyces fergusii]